MPRKNKDPDMNKKQSRLRRALRSRKKMLELQAERLCIHRTPRHTYAQIISKDGSYIITQASTLEPAIRSLCKNTGNIASAELVGKIVAERCREKGIVKLAFDRSGFKYHGRIKALADSARTHGLSF